VLHHLESDGEDAAAVYAHVAEQVCAADDLGFAVAWVAEHHFLPSKGVAPSPLLFLVQLAARTRSIRLGSAVLPAPFYHLVRLAESVAMADVLSGGRLACGISSSGAPDEMQAFGADPAGKHDRLRSTLLWLRRAWSGTAVELPATAGSTVGPVTLTPLPLQRPDEMVWVAASSFGAAVVAGELGYHLLLPSLRPLQASAENVAAYRAALAGAGHDGRDRNIQTTLHLVIDEDHATAMRMAEPIVWRYYERYVRSGIVPRQQDESLAAVMARINFIAGGPEAVAERVAHVATALGLTHVAFQSRLMGLERSRVLHGLELLMGRVAPLMAAASRVE